MSAKVAPDPVAADETEVVDISSSPVSPVKGQATVPPVLRQSTSERRTVSYEHVSETKSYDELLNEMGANTSAVASELDPEKMARDVDLLNARLKRMGKGLLNPRGKLMTYWDFFTIGALIWTSTFTPYEVCLLWEEKKFTDPDWLDWLFVINIFINLIFLVDMCFNFFLPYKESIRKGGGTVKSHKKIAKNYLLGWFPVDIVSMLPVDYVLMAVEVEGNVQVLRLIRIIRLLRLLKLTRILRASRIFSRWENQISMSYGTRSLIQLFIGITVLLHWLACALGLMAQLGAGAARTSVLQARVDVARLEDPTCTGCDLQPNNPYCKSPCLTSCELTQFAMLQLNQHFPGATFSAETIAAEESLASSMEAWVCRYAADGAIRGMPEYHADVYFAALYVAMIQLGGGVGSIVPQNIWEYVFFWVCIWLGSVIWAGVVGTICAVLTTSDPATLQFKQDMDSLNYFLRDMNMPNDLCVRAREYLRNKRELYKTGSYSLMLQDLLSEDLKITVVKRMSGNMLKQVWYLNDLEDGCLVDLSLSISRVVFAPREKIPCDRLNILVRGVAAKAGNILTPVVTWGEDIIVTARALRDKRTASALTYVELAYLTRETLDEVLTKYPASAKKVQEAAMKIAMQRAIVVVSEFIKLMRESKAGGGEAGWSSIASPLMQNIQEQLAGNSGKLDGAAIIPFITGQPLKEIDDEDDDDSPPDASPGKPKGGEGGVSADELAAVSKKLDAQGKQQKELASQVAGMQSQLNTIVSLLRDVKAAAAPSVAEL